jgi:hypothetical protein
MASVESDSGRSAISQTWFDAVGARGFASLGAALGLVLSLAMVWQTAPPAPASQAEVKSPAVNLIEQAAGDEGRPSVAPKVPASPPVSPQPLVSAPPVEVTPIAIPSPAPVSSPAPPSSAPSADSSAPETDPGTPTPTTPTDGGFSGSSSSSGSSGGSVHVRGYTRKNGTYVAPYTRRSSRR